MKNCFLTLLCAATAASAPAQTFTTLFNFDNLHGAIPTNMSLVQGLNGDLYGTTAGGGSANCDKGCGTIFKISPAGSLTTLHHFAGTDGSAPRAGLLLGPDGTFYGTTSEGGANGFGTVFKLTAAGELLTMHSFDSTDGANPWAGLILGQDGNLYGDTLSGGTGACGGGCGTVFKITPAGVLTSLYSMNSSDGYFSYGGLVEGTGGNFYGTTEWAGSKGYGIVFSITGSGELTTLCSFGRAEDHWPTAPLAALGGNFYGTTAGGDLETGTRGNVFRITPTGTLTPIYEFKGGTDGGYANGGLIVGSDGNFYGTTVYFPENALGPCGFYGCGNVFEVTPEGAFTTLHSFVETDGGNPLGGLVQGTDGNFYGTTGHGGAKGFGTVFKLSTGLGPFIKTLPAAARVGTAIRILGTDLTGATSVTFNGVPAAITIDSPTTLSVVVPPGATTGKVQVTTPHGRLLSIDNFIVRP